MNRTALRQIIGDLENACFRLSLAVIDEPEKTEQFAREFDVALKTAKLKLEEEIHQRFPETAGNLFRACDAHDRDDPKRVAEQVRWDMVKR